MLQYFAADPNPKQGFIRALSVQLGQHLKLSSLGHLIKVSMRIKPTAKALYLPDLIMPMMIFSQKSYVIIVSLSSTYMLYIQSMPSIEEDTELSSLEPDADSSEHEQEVSITAILAVIRHKITNTEDKCPLPPACLSLEEHTHVLRQR